MTTTMEGNNMSEQVSLFEEEQMEGQVKENEMEERRIKSGDRIVKATLNGETVHESEEGMDPLQISQKEGDVAPSISFENESNEGPIEPTDQEEMMIRLEDGRSYSMDEWHAPVFFEGPTREMVESWKEEHGKIYMVPFDFNTFIIRGLTRPEYRSIQQERAKLTESNEQEPLEARLSRKFDNEELIAAICTVWPLEAQTEEYFIEKVPAGTAGILAEMIYDKSAFRALTPPIAL